jgi:putative Mg2+ transporter-C (MgtC) family protein
MEWTFDYEQGIKLILSFVVGTVIGFEREYHSKAAGLRTMIMTCLGSTIFTEISMSIGGSSPDRIASNIITGIGFLGAGVIFKDGLTISGITTATTIWICAALGMAIGAGEYFISLIGSVVVLLVLVALQNVTLVVERFHQARSYRIVVSTGHTQFIRDVELLMKEKKLWFLRRKEFKNEQGMILYYEVTGGQAKLDTLNQFLQADQRVASYEF